MNRHVSFRPAACDRTVTIRTPENIELKYNLAGIGTRGAAYLLDSLILFCLMWICAQAAPVVLQKSPAGSGGWIAAISGLLTFALVHGYFIWFEWKGNGQSPGKKALGIRVVKEGGYALTFTDSLLRNLLRFVDFLPFLNAVGLTSICVTRHAQRLGDLVAGTLVVHQGEVQIGALAPAIPETPPTRLASHQLLALPTDVHDLAIEFFRYVDTLVPLVRREIVGDIVNLVTRTTGLAPGGGQSSEGFLAAVIRQAGRVDLAGEPPTASNPPHSAV